MPSHSFNRWACVRAQALDEIADAHASVGGEGRGRRHATQQINHAYAVLLSSHFQGFCRDLHSECVDHLVALTPPALQPIIRAQFIWGRALDRGNPNPGNIGTDFGRLGLAFWAAVRAERHLNDRRQELLDEVNTWRNAIAHEDFDPGRLGGTTALHLPVIRQWRNSLNILAASFDAVMRDHLETQLGASPW